MKKMIMMLAAVAMAACAQAAMVNWKTTKGGLGDSFNGVNYYAVLGSDYTYALANLAGEGGTDWVTMYAIGGDRVAVGGTRGEASANLELDSESTYALFVFTDGIADGNTYMTTGLIDATGYLYEPPSWSPGEMDLGKSSSSFTVTGTISSVPEPTSGLLLLLGMAGLALKRKVA